MHMKKHLGYFLLIESYNCQLDRHGKMGQLLIVGLLQKRSFVKESMMLE